MKKVVDATVKLFTNVGHQIPKINWLSMFEYIKRQAQKSSGKILIISLGLLIGFILTVIFSSDPLETYKIFLIGPISRLNRFSTWIEESIMLTFVGLAVVICFQAKQFVIGAEGQLYVGALIAGIVSIYINLPTILHIPLALFCGGCAGFLYGWIPGILKTRYRVDEFISSLMLNYIAILIYNLILINWLKVPNVSYNRSADFLPSAVLYVIFSGTQITITLFIALVAVVATYFFLYKTKLGYEIRMTGASSKFAFYGGISTHKVIPITTAISGFVAGLAGAALVMSIFKFLISNISSGLGFDGIVVSLLANSNPLGVPIAALFYGYLRASADIVGRTTDMPREIVIIIEAIIILLITAKPLLNLLLTSRKSRKRTHHVN